MNIGIFTDSFTPKVNGIVTSLLLFTKQFKNLGHEVFIFAPSGDSADNQKEQKIFRLPSITAFGNQVKLAVPAIRTETVAKLNLDIIHTQSPGPIGALGAHVGKKLKIPLINTYHTRVERYAQYYLHFPAWTEKTALSIVAKLFYNKHNAIIAPSSGIKAELEQFVKPPISVIPTGVDIEKNNLLSKKYSTDSIFQKYHLNSNWNFIMTASRLGKEKNIGFIINSFVKIKTKSPNTKLLIAGDGPEKERLIEVARSLKIENDIIFLGFLAKDELFSIYKICKAFVFASLTETQGMAVLETMALGLPVVAVKAIGTEDLISGDVGGFMTSENEGEFCEKTIELIYYHNLFQTKSREAILHAQNFSIQKMAEKTLLLYKETIQNFNHKLK